MGKKVLLRADFNVAIDNGQIKEEFKLKACKASVDYIAAQKDAKLAIISHLGRPDGEVKQEFSLLQMKDRLEQILGKKIIFATDCVGSEVAEKLSALNSGEILLLENVRFHKEDEINDAGFAKQLAENFDLFVNDAFSVCHRDQASVTGVPKVIPGCAGFWLQKEIDTLNHALHEPERPATAVIGGAKIETKMPLIQRFEKTYDNVLVGGRVANEAIDQGLDFSPKVVLAHDFAKDRLDIGEKTIRRFAEIITHSKLVIWNGPMGKFEEPPYDNGTRKILEAILETDAYAIIGGGESVQVLEENGLMDRVGFVSTGGGAMLEYLSGNPMPGIEVLKK